MDERRLRYFVAVVEADGVTAAARRLHVAQPSLSQALQALERELGTPLFHRVGRRLRLSAAGEALLAPARQALSALDAARGAVAGVRALEAGTLHLAALATLAVEPMAGLVGRYRALHPGVQVRMREAETAEGLSALVADGSCELGAAHLTQPRAGLLARPLGRQELLLVLPPQASALAGSSARPLAARELARTPLVVGPVGTSTRNLLEQALAALGVAPRIAVETSAREAILALVLAGAGAALMPAPQAQEAERRGAIVRALSPAITRPIGLVHRDAPLSPAARAFLELVQAGTRSAQLSRGAASTRSKRTASELSTHTQPR
jgi:LysR family carnitine catabolism transcriptional activator